MVRETTITWEMDKQVQKIRKKYSARIAYTEYVILATTVDIHTQIYARNGKTMEDAKV